MLKLALITVVVVCLSAGYALPQQVGGNMAAKRTRQHEITNVDRRDAPSVLVHSFHGKSPTELSKSPDHQLQSKFSRKNSGLTEFDGIHDFQTPFSMSHSLYDLKMPGEPEGFGLFQSAKQPALVKTASLVDRKRIESLLMPGAFLGGLGALASIQNTPIDKTAQRDTMLSKRLEIEVSHSSHVFRLYSEGSDGSRETLYECKIGLGAPEFPTPVGVYYVTHIYDQDPWWIPPANRAWAAGDSPSQRVYGGTMAPLLKKKIINLRKKSRGQDQVQEDFVENKVKLEDYGYRFHGTNQPRSIGRNQSHGCVRMLSEDAKKVSNLIKDQVGALDRRESENGPFVVLKAPVKLNLVK